MSSTLNQLANLGNGLRSGRISSYDRSGSFADSIPIPAGETLVVSELQGAGAIRHIWMTTKEGDFSWMTTKEGVFNLKALVLRIYWDGESTPSVQCPLGDFFGLGHGVGNYVNSLPIQTSYLAMNCWFTMPYSNGAKITVTNEHPDANSFLYYYIDYQSYSDPQQVAGTGRFHAKWKRELLTKQTSPNHLNVTGEHNYVILDVKGKGHYVGCFLNLDTNEPGWWGEGDDMFFIDGEQWPPKIHGTGMEDYFCGAWNYNNLLQTDNKPYYGYHFKGNGDYTGKHSQYRFHVEDPIYFEKSLLFSNEHGHDNDKQGDWSSTAFWYQVGRTEPLPDLGSYADRVPYAFGGVDQFFGKDRKGLPY